MRVAALYDIHGNLPALEAVLAAVEDERVDRIVIGGDVVPGPLPVQTIERLRRLGDTAVFVGGNGDRWVVEAFDALSSADVDAPRRPWAAWAAEMIDRGDRDLLASFCAAATVDVEDLGPVLFCHASPRDDEEMLTSLAPDRRWRSALEGVDESVVVCGHTHTQFERRVGPWRVLTPAQWECPTRAARVPTGCSLARASSSGAPTTTSRLRSPRCAPVAIRAQTTSSATRCSLPAIHSLWPSCSSGRPAFAERY
jgi:predicted phosphodiesterase